MYKVCLIWIIDKPMETIVQISDQIEKEFRQSMAWIWLKRGVFTF